MHYRLRTLLIALAVVPPVLATAIFLALFLFTPWDETPGPPGKATWPTFPGIVCFALFWLMCGVVWLAIMRTLEGPR